MTSVYSNDLINIYTINNFQSNNEGTYYVAVTDDSGISITSKYMKVTLVLETFIKDNLNSSEVLEGTSHELIITTIGNHPLKYIWYKDERKIQTTINNIYKIDNAKIDDGGIYYVKIQLGDNTFINSDSVLINVIIDPVITQNRIICEKTDTSITTFYITTINYNTLSNYICEWYYDNNKLDIDGINTKIQTLYNGFKITYSLYINKINYDYSVNDKNTHIYRGEVKNTKISNISSNTEIELKINPLLKIEKITSGPINLQDTDMLNIEMKIIGGTPPYNYYWYIEKKMDNFTYYSLLYNNTNIYKKPSKV
jgi:hypothetical protein